MDASRCAAILHHAERKATMDPYGRPFVLSPLLTVTSNHGRGPNARLHVIRGRSLLEKHMVK
jgi:hypothetical protein